MISSEVQRTLVKSPPELWAELGDPAALARHLGESGEIRITRTEPERLVEWEADGASGTVLLSPSGWGTKVKLTMSRTLPDSAGQGSAPSPTDPQQAPPGLATPEAATSEPPSAEPSAPEPATPEAAAPDPGAPEPLSPPPTRSATVPAPPPASRSAEPQGEPVGISTAVEPIRPDGAASTRAQPQLAMASALAAQRLRPLGRQSPTSPAQPRPEPAPEPRRGFFARLFGRRPRPQEQPATVVAETDTARSQPPAPEPARRPAPAPPPQAAAVFAALSSALTREACTAVDPFALSGTPAPTAAPAPPRPQALESGSAEPSGGAAPAQAPAAPAGGLSAELRAAEEIAAEEDTAVLTAVLDRLGAAHHRPFSRS